MRGFSLSQNARRPANYSIVHKKLANILGVLVKKGKKIGFKMCIMSAYSIGCKQLKLSFTQRIILCVDRSTFQLNHSRLPVSFLSTTILCILSFAARGSLMFQLHELRTSFPLRGTKLTDMFSVFKFTARATRINDDFFSRIQATSRRCVSRSKTIMLTRQFFFYGDCYTWEEWTCSDTFRLVFGLSLKWRSQLFAFVLQP